MSKLLDELQLTGAMTVPLTLRERTIGAISLVSAESRLRYTLQDLELAEELARRIAIAVENARLYRSAQELNQELEQRVIERTVQLRESEEKFSKAFLSSPVAVSIASLPDGRYINVNEALAKLTGYSKEELIGHTSAEMNLVDSTARTKILEATQKYGFARNVEIQIRTKSNQLVDVLTSIERIELSGKPCMLSVNYDITERKRAEGKFRGLLESAPDAVVVVDGKGIIQLINSQTEKMFGYQRNELVGQPVEIIVPNRFRKKHVKHRENYYIEHPVRPMGTGLDLFGLRKNGSEFPIEISLGPLETEDGILVSAAIRDITERKLAEADIQKLNQDLNQRASQLETANKELESFSYSVSHDLRAPLRSIDGFSQALLEDYGESLPPEGRNYLERVRAAAQRMAVLIDDLLALSRVTRTPLQPRFINLSNIASEIANILRDNEPNRQVNFTITQDLMVEGDPRLLRIVFENLLGNAWKFTSKREHAVIEFGQKERAKERTFFIRDNGAGFDMAYADKLFGVFQRLHSVNDYPGTGIGLATVHRIITIHGGRIWADSKEGKGATFYFTINGGSDER
jgi:PAS domain S-box-containing protein